jgi:hypothetical protein
MKFGSHLYGTDTPSSDLDFKSVFVPSARDILLGRVNDVVVTNTKTKNTEKNTVDDIDNEGFSLRKYLDLLSKGQTVAIDMLFAPPEMIVETNSSLIWIWKEIYNNRHRLITKQSASFVGYCRQQANKYGIRGSRMKEVENTKVFFERLLLDHHPVTTVGNFHDEIMNELVKDAQHTEIVELKNPNGMIIKHLSCAGKKVPYTVSIKEAVAIYRALYDKYGERALKAKNNEGIDWKAMSHAVRVATEAIELATTGFIHFPLLNKDRITKIKLGEINFHEVADEIAILMEEVEIAFAKSSLREKPDYEWIDSLVMSTYHDQFKEMKV